MAMAAVFNDQFYSDWKEWFTYNHPPDTDVPTDAEIVVSSEHLTESYHCYLFYLGIHHF